MNAYANQSGQCIHGVALAEHCTECQRFALRSPAPGGPAYPDDVRFMAEGGAIWREYIGMISLVRSGTRSEARGGA